MSTTQTVNKSYQDLADRIRSGKVSGANMQALVDALAEAGAIQPSSKPIPKDPREEFAQKFGAEVQIKIDRNIRPTYLSGCKGHLGSKRGTKWEFFPAAGTRAHDRSGGRAWRIPARLFTPESQLVIEGQEEMLAEGRIS